MSYCALIPFDADGDSTGEWVEFRNAWGFGACVWTIMQRHLGWRDDWYEDSARLHDWRGWGSRLSADDIQPLWDLYKNPDVPPYERIAMALTLDRIYVPREVAPKVAEALRTFHATHIESGSSRWTWSHLAGIADAMIAATENGAECVGFYPMSVSDNPWQEWDHEADESVWLTPQEHGTSIVELVPDLLRATPTEADR